MTQTASCASRAACRYWSVSKIAQESASRISLLLYGMLQLNAPSHIEWVVILRLPPNLSCRCWCKEAARVDYQTTEVAQQVTATWWRHRHYLPYVATFAMRVTQGSICQILVVGLQHPLPFPPLHSPSFPSPPFHSLPSPSLSSRPPLPPLPIPIPFSPPLPSSFLLPSPPVRSRPLLLRLEGLGSALAPPVGLGGARLPNGIWWISG